MSDHPVAPGAPELERYELNGRPAYTFAVDRRQFVKLFGGGIAVLLAGPASALQESGGGRAGDAAPRDLGAWLHIAEDGAVTVYTGKVEIGQNSRTSLTQAVAEELRAPIGAVTLVMGDTDLVPFDMGTFGSRTTPTMAPLLRKAAVVARELLIDLAAERWHAGRATLVAANGRVTHPPTGRALSFGQLAKDQKLVKTIPDEVALTPALKWKVAGTSASKVGGRAFVTGAHRFTSDMTRPGMVYGKIARPSAFGAVLAAVDTSEAEKIPGVAVVRDGTFVGVTAPTPTLAEKAVAVIHANWNVPAQLSNAGLFDFLKKNPLQQPQGGESARFTRGSVDEGLAAADQKLDQSYTVAYIAHTPLEPRAAVAEWTDDKLTVWTGTQRPFGVRQELAEAFHMPEDHVRVIVPDTGSAYGGKHTGETAVEAARLAKAAGKPVKLVWTREEEFTWAYFRPAGVIDVRSGVRRDGGITAWEFHNYNSGPAAIRTFYDVPHQHIEFHLTRAPLRQGSYRGLAATANQFARETHMDELARAVGMEPLEFRYRNLKDPRFRAVLEAAAKRFGWGRSAKTAGRGFGVAGGFEKGGYIATCVEVAIEGPKRTVRVVRVVSAFDCGAVVNPDHLKNQIEGSLVMGLGGALFESIQFEIGRIVNSTMSRYRVPRFDDVPEIDVIVIDHKDLPSAGAGETPMIALAPAIGNAIFDAAGVRLRSLPLAPGGLEAGPPMTPH